MKAALRRVALPNRALPIQFAPSFPEGRDGTSRLTFFESV